MSESGKSGGAGGQGSRGEIAPSLSASKPAFHPRNLWLISSFAVALIAIWLYRRALSFVYFNDDPSGHFAWMEGRALWQFFASSADYGYYRPVVFAALRLMELLFGNETWPHNPVADHALLLLLHGINTTLVWALARRLSGRDVFAWATALVFAFVPFSYEAVAYVASLTHPLLLFWALLTLLLFDRASYSLVTPRSSLVTLLALVTLSLGLLTNENGLFIFPALVGLNWVRRPAATPRERARRLWPFAALPVAFVVLWLFIPKNSEQGLNTLAEIGRNLIPFLQTLIYPLLPVLRLDSGDVWALVLSAVVFVALVGLLARQVGVWRLWAFALGWFALSILPALLFLQPAYVYGSPRLSYLPSVGVAMLWAIPILWLGERVSQKQGDSGRRSAVGRRQTIAIITLAAVYILALILPHLPFIRCQLDFYAETSRFARGMAAAGMTAPARRTLVFVNAPFFFSSTPARSDGCPSPYPWTPVGGVLIPPYAQPRDFVRFNGGPDRATMGVTFAGYGPGWRTFGPEIDGEALRRHAADDAAYVFDLLSGTIHDLSAVWRPGAGAAEAPLASFGDVLELADAQWVAEGDLLTAALDWRVAATPDAPLAAFVHVYDAAGALVAQSDGPPGGGLAPQSLWQSGDAILDERRIDLSALPPSDYTLAVGVYTTADGARLATVADGQPLSDDIYLFGMLKR